MDSKSNACIRHLYYEFHLCFLWQGNIRPSKFAIRWLVQSALSILTRLNEMSCKINVSCSDLHVTKSYIPTLARSHSSTILLPSTKSLRSSSMKLIILTPSLAFSSHFHKLLWEIKLVKVHNDSRNVATEGYEHMFSYQSQ